MAATATRGGELKARSSLHAEEIDATRAAASDTHQASARILCLFTLVVVGQMR